MNNEAVLDELDLAVDAAIAGRSVPNMRADIGEMLDAAAEMRIIANADFRARLKFDLIEQALTSMTSPTARTSSEQKDDFQNILPTLLLSGYATYPVRRANFAASLVAHAVVLILVLSSGMWMAKKTFAPNAQVISLLTDSPYVLPPDVNKSGGGGGGGDRDLLPASKGALPKTAREQIAPPVVVVRNFNPKLAVEPTVVAPLILTLPQSIQLGDPMSAVLAPSNGTGSGGGIGSGTGTGVGSGRGPGVGPGWGGGMGGGVYRIGGGVSAPRVVYDPDPDYSEEARKARFQGTVFLWVVVGPDGKIHDTQVARSLGMGLDEKAVEKVRTWRFEPAMKDGRPVAVQMQIEVSFRLY